MDRDAVIHARNEDLEPCPFCGGRPVVVKTKWDWGPYDLRHVEIRCRKCEALFVYDWRTDPHRRVPHAIEWWNTRTPAQKRPETIQGFYLEDLLAVAALLKENDITVLDLNKLVNNLEKCITIVQQQFARDLDKQLQEYLAKGGMRP